MSGLQGLSTLRQYAQVPDLSGNWAVAVFVSQFSVKPSAFLSDSSVVAAEQSRKVCHLVVGAKSLLGLRSQVMV